MQTPVGLKQAWAFSPGEIVTPGGIFALNRNQSESLKCHDGVVCYVCFL